MNMFYSGSAHLFQCFGELAIAGNFLLLANLESKIWSGDNIRIFYGCKVWIEKSTKGFLIDSFSCIPVNQNGSL